MQPYSIPPAADCQTVLPGADFVDAFAIDLTQPVAAPDAAQRAFANMPGWARHLLTLRNAMMAPLGLKTRSDGDGPHLGLFPVLTSTPARVVLGFDDRHLDFRIVVDAVDKRVTMTTLVRRHGWFGRAYLAVVLPFHRRIVPALLRQVAG